MNKLLQRSRLREIRRLLETKGSSCKKSRPTTTVRPTAIQPHQAEAMPCGGFQTVTTSPPPRREGKVYYYTKKACRLLPGPDQARRKPPWLERATWRGQSSIESASSKRPPNCAFSLSHLLGASLGPAASSGTSRSGERPADAAGQLCCRQGHRPRPSFRHTSFRVQGAMPRISAASACRNRKSKLQRERVTVTATLHSGSA